MDCPDETVCQPVELTAELLNTLIEKITVHEAVKGEDGSREQEVEIYYRFIGKIDCPFFFTQQYL